MRIFKIVKNVFMRVYKNGKQSWEDDVITKRIRKMLCLVKSRKGVCKRRINEPTAKRIH